MNRTRITWADFTWNPVTGCTPASEGCLNCYAKRDRARWLGDKDFKLTLHPKKLDEPIRRKRPAVIFVVSTGDLFHPDVPDDFIKTVWQVMAIAHQHQFLVLTKRAERMLEFCSYQHTLNNVWLGVTAENQKRALERIPLLLQTPAAHRFLSLEPLLEGINLGLRGTCPKDWGHGYAMVRDLIDWVIVGGESGPGARPCREEWVTSVHIQCEEAIVPFFFKQGGANWIPSIAYGVEGRWGREGIWLHRQEWPEGLKRT